MFVPQKSSWLTFEGMRKIIITLFILVTAVSFVACKKTSFITSKDALLSTSADTLHFDTVFTSTGSITNRFKIFNLNDQKLRITNIKLMGGNASFFKINVDGTAGANFSNIEVEANDSLYVFVTVSINPNAANLAFVVQDSILINYNGNEKFVQLDAYGQNAHFLRNRRISSNTTWNNDLPFVILGGITVDEDVTLTINEGCKVYAHADAPVIINGTLKVLGQKYDSTKVIFRGDRLDEDFRDYPGSWPGIYFSETSRDNVLTYGVIRNAYQGIIALQPAANNNPKVTLNECIIDNIYDAGIVSLNSSITARNCLISNCGNNIAIGSGGNYYFNHCTVSSFGNVFIKHKNPVLTISNANQGQTFPLNALFRNCIFYGDSAFVKNEIAVDKKGSTPFTVAFENVLYRVQDQPSGATFVSSIKNESPQFDSIDGNKRSYNFRLKESSPAINKGVNTGILLDLDGKPRGGAAGQPDIGAYEF